MLDRHQVFGDCPEVFLRGHPVHGVEAAQVDRPRIVAQRFLAFEVVVMLEVAHRELAEGAVDRLAIAQAGGVGFGQRPPVATGAEDGEHGVGGGGGRSGAGGEDRGGGGGGQRRRRAAHTRAPPSQPGRGGGAGRGGGGGGV